MVGNWGGGNVDFEFNGAPPLVFLPPHGTLNKVCAVFIPGPDSEAGQLVVEIFD